MSKKLLKRAIFGLALCSFSASSAYSASSSSSGFARCTPYEGLVQTAVDRWWPDLPVWRLWLAQLYQESRCDPLAVSPVGARGLAQFMPATWADQARRLQFDPYADPHTAKHAIPAGAAYMASLRQTWKRGREPLAQNVLAQASYNAGTGNILKAQKVCGDAKRWEEIRPCLDVVTGVKNAHETGTYIERIERWWRQLEAEG